MMDGPPPGSAEEALLRLRVALRRFGHEVARTPVGSTYLRALDWLARKLP